jgi:hypothetical protein
MSDITKNLFDKDPKRWYDGCSSLEELNKNMHGFEGALHGYLLILNDSDFDVEKLLSYFKPNTLFIPFHI